jgi:hypothetical protein
VLLARALEEEALGRAHQALELAAGVGGVDFQMLLGLAPDADHALGVDAHDRRRDLHLLGVLDDGGPRAVQPGDGGVGGAQVDAEFQGVAAHWGSPPRTETHGFYAESPGG